MGNICQESPKKIIKKKQNIKSKDSSNISQQSPKNIIIQKQKKQSKVSPNPITLIKEEEQKVPEIKEHNGELDIKNESFSEEEEKEEKEDEDNFEVIEKEFEQPKLEKKFIISLDFKEKDNKIYRIYELSDRRIAILDYNLTDVKIYSLKTGKIITKMNKEKIKKIIELKNKDIVLNSSHEIYIYKLLPNKNYELYQTINEFNQGTNIMKDFDLFEEKKGKKEYYNLNSVYEMMNGDLVSCNSYGLKIYKKENNGLYKLSFMKELGEAAVNVLEIKKNILIIFHIFFENVSCTFHYYIFKILKFDIEKQELTEINQSSMSDRYYGSGVPFISYLLNNNKYLFVRYGLCLDVYDISKDLEFVNKNEFNFYGMGRSSCNYKFPVDEFNFNYEGDIFVAKGNYETKFFKYEGGFVKSNKLFPFTKQFSNNIIKLKNNDFITYDENKITLLKNLDKSN